MYALFKFEDGTVVRHDYSRIPRGVIRGGNRPTSLEFHNVPAREWFREELHWFQQCKMCLSQKHRTEVRFFSKVTRPDFAIVDDPQKEPLTQCELAKRQEEIASLAKNYAGNPTPAKLNVTLNQYPQEKERTKAMSQSINTVSLKDEEILKSGGTQFNTGAIRSADASGVMYQLISPIGLRRIAETYKEGFDKYGSYNWEKGMPIGDILNHGIRHIYEYLSGDRSEDHLAHAAWNLIAAMHMEESHPELEHGLRPEKPTPGKQENPCA